MKPSIATAIALATLTQAGLAHSAPPVEVRGVDLNAVLSIYDRAREVTLQDAPPRPGPTPLSTVHTLVIDPGHGGENQGAIGVADIHEKFLTLELAYALRDRLQRLYPNLRVVMTRYRDQDVALDQRIHYANERDADLFLSLHYNAATHDRALGHETFYLSTDEALREAATPSSPEESASAGLLASNLRAIYHDLARQRVHEESALLARLVNAAFAPRFRTPNRGVKQANFAVLRNASMPAIVVESAFVTHPVEGEALTHADHRAKIVDALVLAIQNFDRARHERADSP